MSKNRKNIAQMPKRELPKMPAGVPGQQMPSPIDIAKRNVIQSMNSVGSMASGMINEQVGYMGLGSVTEVDVDHSIDIANMLVFKMNAITKEELDRIDIEMGENSDEDEIPKPEGEVN